MEIIIGHGEHLLRATIIGQNCRSVALAIQVGLSSDVNAARHSGF
jgi:hypothetical protein